MNQDQRDDSERPRESKIDPPQFGIELSGTTIAVDAGLERKKTVDRANLQAGINDQNEIPGGIDRQPRGENVVRPVVQEDGDQRDLLRDSQRHLQEICRPALRETARAAWRTGHRRSLRDDVLEQRAVKTATT